MPLNKSLVITPEMKQADAIAAIVNSYRAAIQSMIDRTANERQYDDGNSLASYVNSTVPEWAAERGGSVCLNSFGRFVKWISAAIMPPPSLVSAR